MQVRGGVRALSVGVCYTVVQLGYGVVVWVVWGTVFGLRVLGDGLDVL